MPSASLYVSVREHSMKYDRRKTYFYGVTYVAFCCCNLYDACSKLRTFPLIGILRILSLKLLLQLMSRHFHKKQGIVLFARSVHYSSLNIRLQLIRVTAINDSVIKSL